MELGGVGIEGVLYCYPMKCGLRRVAVATVRGRGKYAIAVASQQAFPPAHCPLTSDTCHLSTYFFHISCQIIQMTPWLVLQTQTSEPLMSGTILVK